MPGGRGMERYCGAAMERAMKIQDVILRAMAKKITWWQAAEVLGMSDRQLRRWRWRWEQLGYDGLYDRRKQRPSPRRVAMETAEQVLALYQQNYFDLNVRHFHEKLKREHGIDVSYTWVKLALQGAGLMRRNSPQRVHRRQRERRPVAGMLLHLDGSDHHWFQDQRRHDLLVILDDATSQIYYAQLVESESTPTVMAALRSVIAERGIFCALYSDRASHFFVTLKAGERVDRTRVTQVGRALRHLGVNMIPAYSPQARGRSERNFRTWQGRLPQELRLRGIRAVEPANEFLRQHYIAEFNRRFQVPAAQPGSAFVPLSGQDLEHIFSQHHPRTVNQDNTVQFHKLKLQIEAQTWRTSLAGCEVLLLEHGDGTLTLHYGPHCVGRYDSQGEPCSPACGKKKKLRATGAVEKTAAGPPWKSLRDSHFPTASTATANS